MTVREGDLASRFLRSFDAFEAEIADVAARCDSGAVDLGRQIEVVEAQGLLDEHLRTQWAGALAVRSRLLDLEGTNPPGREELTLSLLDMLRLREIFSARVARMSAPPPAHPRTTPIPTDG